MKNNIVEINSITQIHNSLDIQKPKHPLVSVIPMSLLSQYNYGDYTYVMDLYQISLKTGVSGAITYGRNSYDFQEGTLVFSKPGQSLSYSENEGTDGEEGWMLIFHPDLIRKSPLGESIDNYTFFSYEANEALHLSNDEKQILTELIQKIEREYENNIDRHSQELIISNIEMVLKYCTRYFDRQFYTRTNLNKDAFSKFEKLLKSYYIDELHLDLGIPTVKYCATELNMSSHYLSDMLRKETGKSAQEHIYNFVINKAKTRLLSSSESISQVAYSLGFEYPQHFSKLFKSKTGYSPVEYRKSS
ncbi:helix-turn-helix domain-containing protein [Flammeovirga agarivorans]|uniref:AraC family transcriptional regulator n=1 Tax=Flammeovirga agarivorans TaxID=2726742 RepID=A0A7X8XVW6_9BACT|nr:helix-turn-helix domain-containing protein [Flammeovirga agarivorans]NLR91490.1 AraC family transcriptional regulator [Flammeovirga agarivorans]